jgi:hypothetical protein
VGSKRGILLCGNSEIKLGNTKPFGVPLKNNIFFYDYHKVDHNVLLVILVKEVLWSNREYNPFFKKFHIRLSLINKN